MNYYNSTIIARKKKVQVSFDVLHALIILSFQVMHFMDNDSGKKNAISECWHREDFSFKSINMNKTANEFLS